MNQSCQIIRSLFLYHVSTWHLQSSVTVFKSIPSGQKRCLCCCDVENIVMFFIAAIIQFHWSKSNFILIAHTAFNKDTQILII